MEHSEALDAIHDIALKLMGESDPARLEKGIEIIHALARHKSVAVMQAEIDDFNKEQDDEPESISIASAGERRPLDPLF